jgi:hypothetical protein
MCAANPVVDARCNDRSYCDGDQPVICAGEYALERLAHCGPTGCAERSDGAQCVVPLDPACSSGEAVFCTVFQERIECSGGRIVSRTQCAVCENNRCVPDGGASSDAADVSDVSDLNDVRDEPDGFDASSDIATDAGD